MGPECLQKILHTRPSLLLLPHFRLSHHVCNEMSMASKTSKVTSVMASRSRDPSSGDTPVWGTSSMSIAKMLAVKILDRIRPSRIRNTTSRASTAYCSKSSFSRGWRWVVGAKGSEREKDGYKEHR